MVARVAGEMETADALERDDPAGAQVLLHLRQRILRRVAAGEDEACEVYEAMVYQICKNITALLPAFAGEPVDRVLLTGGLARSERLVADITASVPLLTKRTRSRPG